MKKVLIILSFLNFFSCSISDEKCEDKKAEIEEHYLHQISIAISTHEADILREEMFRKLIDACDE